MLPSAYMLTEPRGNYQRIGACRELEPQKFFTTLQCIDDKACVMDDPDGA